MFFDESSVGDSGFQAWGNATPGESEEDRQTDRQVQTAGWPGWGKDASAQQCKPPQEERRRCQRSGETKVIVRGRERKGDDNVG